MRQPVDVRHSAKHSGEIHIPQNVELLYERQKKKRFKSSTDLAEHTLSARGPGVKLPG